MVASSQKYRALLGLFCVALAHAGSANAFTRAAGPKSREPAIWETAPIELRISVPTLPPYLSATDATAALAAAADLWRLEAPCGHLQFVIGSTATTAVGPDGINVVAFRGRAWCRNSVERPGNCYDPRRAANTTLNFAGDSRHEHIIDADIELNAVDFHWELDAESNAPGTAHLPRAFAHELGHVLGFGHPCAAPGERQSSFLDTDGAPLSRCTEAPLNSADSLLAPQSGSGNSAHLSRDDVRGVCETYGTQRQTAKIPSSSCACAAASSKRGGGSDATLALLFTGLVLARRRYSKHCSSLFVSCASMAQAKLLRETRSRHSLNAGSRSAFLRASCCRRRISPALDLGRSSRSSSST